MTKEQEKFKDDVCKCLHARKLHGKSNSINFTEGRCSSCNCMNFMIKDNSFTPHSPSYPCHYGQECNCNKDFWLDEFERVFHGKLIPPEYKDILRNFISSAISEAINADRKMLVEIIRKHGEDIINISPMGSLPFVVFQGKADENEKKTIYFQAYRDVMNLINFLVKNR